MSKPFTDEELEIIRETVKHYNPVNNCEKNVDRFLATITADRERIADLKKRVGELEDNAKWQANKILQQHKNLGEYPEVCQENSDLISQLARMKEALEDMVSQFADRSPYKGNLCFNTMGLSALELAFDTLGWDDPQPCPDGLECEYKDCHQASTCGTPTKDGYKRLCGKHYQAFTEGE